MLCPECGSFLAGDARFCFKCGAQVTRAPGAEGERALDATLHDESPPPLDPFVGQTLDGKYLIESRLSAGGMGTVYRATRIVIGDTVAIKILHSEQLAEPQARERFRREAQAAARLKHPNAVSIYDFGEATGGVVYLVMELVEGESLRQLLRRRGTLPAVEAVELATQVCAALAEAHRREIVHRDVKPDNIIVGETTLGAHVKVLDFGIAKLRDQTAGNLTQTGSVMGTPHYMSPEQCTGDDLDGRSDIYSLGIVLYEMLTGQVPFQSAHSTAVVIQHVNNEPKPLRALNPKVPAAIEGVVLRALQKRPEARPQTAWELARELKAAVRGEPDTGTAPRATGPPVPPPTIGLPAQAKGAGGAGHNLPPTVALPLSPAQQQQQQAAAASGNQSIETRPAARAAQLFSGAPQTRSASSMGVGLLVLALAVLVAAGLVGWMFWKNAGGGAQANASAPQNGEAKPTGANTGHVSSAQTNANGAASQRGANGPAPAAPQGMIYISGGDFMMGADDGDDYERPAHRVEVAPFFIDAHEVTNEEYARFVAATGHAPPPTWAGGRVPEGAARRPVTGVTWDDASTYAAWARKRLPTEEEWELAARGREGRRYPWGNEWRDGAANVERPEATAITSVWRGMTDVGASPGASPFGLYDVSGNAWEWTASDLRAYPGGRLPPPPKWTSTAEVKVIRGGSYVSRRNAATATYRRGYPARDEDYRNTGFRCARDVR